MRTETSLPDDATPAQRSEFGRSLRSDVPRGALAAWEAPTDRADPVAVLEAQIPSRLHQLIPIRHRRMLASPFAFYRGSAAIMSADLAAGAATGMTAQICGDAHLANFGVFGSPERALVFDLNDFDETHPGPWEWDVKRLAASGVLLARDRDWPAETQALMARTAATAYREAMATFASLSNLDVWYARVTDDQIVNLAQQEGDSRRVEKQLEKARRNDVHRACAKFTEVVDGRRRIVHQPPLVSRLSQILPLDDAARVRDGIIAMAEQYIESLPSHLQQLVDSYELIDVALKVVGVGSVGTRCFIALAQGRDPDDLFFFQIKEAQESVVAPHVTPAVPYDNQGYRVVHGQHLMQSASDIFLGWTRMGTDYYLRQFRDMKGGIDPVRIQPAAALVYMGMCGWTLARAHARSGDRIAIAAYLGSGGRFDRAIEEFSLAYADQVAQDYARFVEAATSGRIQVAEAG